MQRHPETQDRNIAGPFIFFEIEYYCPRNQIRDYAIQPHWNASSAIAETQPVLRTGFARVNFSVVGRGREMAHI